MNSVSSIVPRLDTRWLGRKTEALWIGFLHRRRRAKTARQWERLVIGGSSSLFETENCGGKGVPNPIVAEGRESQSRSVS